MPIKMLTFVDDLGQVSKNFGLRQLSSYSLSIKYSYDLCRHICKSFFKICLPHVGKDCEATHLKRHVSIMSSIITVVWI